MVCQNEMRIGWCSEIVKNIEETDTARMSARDVVIDGAGRSRAAIGNFEVLTAAAYCLPERYCLVERLVEGDPGRRRRVPVTRWMRPSGSDVM
jgi:hypothetical protein